MNKEPVLDRILPLWINIIFYFSFLATVEEIDLKQIDVTTLKPLVMAEVPEVEDFFDITVTLAASPSNFTVSFF